MAGKRFESNAARVGKGEENQAQQLSCHPFSFLGLLASLEGVQLWGCMK